MALNGINLPLAFTGQEAIFQRVGLSVCLWQMWVSLADVGLSVGLWRMWVSVCLADVGLCVCLADVGLSVCLWRMWVSLCISGGCGSLCVSLADVGLVDS